MGEDQHAESGARAAADGVCQLEALEAITVLDLLAGDVEDGVKEFGPLRVVALREVVAGRVHPEDEVVRAEEHTVRTGPDRVHRASLKVDKNRPGHVSTTCQSDKHYQTC